MFKRFWRAGLFFSMATMSVATLAHKGPGACDASMASCNSWSKLIAYPQKALREGLEGRVTLGVKIDVNGHAFDCEILESSGHDALDKDTCRQFEKVAHFNPALDENGKPTIGFYCSTIDWFFSPRTSQKPYRSPLCDRYYAQHSALED